MSMVMAPNQNFPMVSATHENSSPTQPSIGFMNNFSTNPNSNPQWQQQMSQSPTGAPQNGPGSNQSPIGNMMPSSSSNNVSSPLVNSMNGGMMHQNPGSAGHGMTSAGTPQQPSSVKTPLSVHQQQPTSNPASNGPLLLRNPFEEDLENRPASRQQMPPPPSNNQRLLFDAAKDCRFQFYRPMELPYRCRLPPAYNTLGSEQIPYPPCNLNRSPSIPPQKAPLIGMPMSMPVGGPPASTAAATPATTTTTKKRVTKKQKEQQEKEKAEQAAAAHQQQMQQMQQNAHMNGVYGAPNQFAMPDPNRPCSSHDPTNCSDGTGGRARTSPNTAQLHMKGRSPSTDSLVTVPGMIPRGLKLMPNDKCVVDGFACLACSMPITRERQGIRCTAMGQGCFNSFHMECVNLSIEAYMCLVRDSRCEWVCLMCQKTKHLAYRA